MYFLFTGPYRSVQGRTSNEGKTIIKKHGVKFKYLFVCLFVRSVGRSVGRSADRSVGRSGRWGLGGLGDFGGWAGCWLGGWLVSWLND